MTSRRSRPRSPRPRPATSCSPPCTRRTRRRRSTASSTCSRRTSSSRCACSWRPRCRASCTQQLIPTADGQGRAVAARSGRHAGDPEPDPRGQGPPDLLVDAGRRTVRDADDGHVARPAREVGRDHPGARLRALPRPRGAPAPRSAVPASRARRPTTAATTPAGMSMGMAHGRHDDGRDVARWHRPTSTRSATSAGTWSPAPWWPTASCWSSSACARWATRPSRWARRRRASTSRSTSRRRRSSSRTSSVFSRQFATMINSGLPILRALSILADQTSNTTLAETLTACRMDVEQGASLSGRDAEAPEGLQRPLHLDGEVGRDRRVARRHPAAPRGDAGARGRTCAARSSRR